MRYFRNFGNVNKVPLGTQLDKRRSSAHVQQLKCSKCRPLARTHAASLKHHSSIALLITLCFMSAQTLFQFVDIMYFGLVDAVLHQPQYLVVDWIQVWEIWNPEFLI